MIAHGIGFCTPLGVQHMVPCSFHNGTGCNVLITRGCCCPAGEVIASTLQNRQCTVLLSKGDCLRCRICHIIRLRVKRYGILIGHPLRIQGHCGTIDSSQIRDVCTVRIARTGSRRRSVPTVKRIAGFGKCIGSQRHICIIDSCCIFHGTRAAVCIVCNLIMICRPVGIDRRIAGDFPDRWNQTGTLLQ